MDSRDRIIAELRELVAKQAAQLLATIGWMKSRAHCSYTTIEKYCDDVLQVSVPRGYLAKLCNGVISDSLSGAHEELKRAISEQSQLGSDETSLKHNGKKHWIVAMK